MSAFNPPPVLPQSKPHPRPSQSSGGSSSLRQRLLVVEIADELDPFFHHSLAVGEAEFTELKAEQAILVEFGAFPAHFVELLHCCCGRGGSSGGGAASPHIHDPGAASPTTSRLRSEHGGGGGVASSGSFGLQLSIRDPAPGAPSTLSVVETNPFKHLTHLSLSLRGRCVGVRLSSLGGSLEAPPPCLPACLSAATTQA